MLNLRIQTSGKHNPDNEYFLNTQELLDGALCFVLIFSPQRRKRRVEGIKPCLRFEKRLKSSNMRSYSSLRFRSTFERPPEVSSEVKNRSRFRSEIQLFAKVQFRAQIQKSNKPRKINVYWHFRIVRNPEKSDLVYIICLFWLILTRFESLSRRSFENLTGSFELVPDEIVSGSVPF